MHSRVEQHVGDCVSNFAWGSQHVDVAAVGEDCAYPSKDAIDGSSEACRERFEAAGEVLFAGRLDDQVDVVALDRVVNESEAAAVADFAPAPLELADEPSRSQGRDVLSYFQRDVTWMTRSERCSSLMRIAAVVSRLSPRTRTGAAPARRQFELEPELSRLRFHVREVLTSVCQMRSRGNLVARRSRSILNSAMFRSRTSAAPRDRVR